MTITSDFSDFMAAEDAKFAAALADTASAHAALTAALAADTVDKAAATDALAKLAAANAAVQSSAPVASSAGLVLFVSEDAYKGDAQFTVTVDGQQVGGAFSATAAHGKDTGAVAIPGTFAPGPHAVAVKLINDLYEGSPDKDRNLYLDGATYGGKLVLDAKRDLLNDAPQSFTFTVPGVASTTTAPVASTPTSATSTTTASTSTDPATPVASPAPTPATPITTPIVSTPVAAPVASAPVSDPAGTPAAAAGMKLIFEDDFPGTALDPKKWYDGPKPDGGEYGDAFLVPINDPHASQVYTVSNGTLRLRAAYDPNYVDPQGYGRKWYGGEISSAFPDGTASAAVRQGYFQARIKLPYGLGTWPAFWLLNTAGILKKAGYPGDVEIDILEAYGQWIKNGGYLVTVHDYGGPDNIQFHSDPTTNVYDLGADFHDYGCLITGTEIVMDIDGHEICRAKLPKAATIDTFYMLLTMDMTTQWGAIVIPPAGSDGVVAYDMNIQRVRVWSADGTAVATPVPVPAPTLSPVSADSTAGSSSLSLMTSNSAPAGSLSGTAQGGNSAYMAYDGSTYSKRNGVWYSFTVNNGPDRTVSADATILGIAVTSADVTEGPQTMSVVMGEDAASATAVATLSFAPWTKTLQRQVFHFASPVKAKYLLPEVTVFANGKNAVSLDQVEWLTSL